MDKKKILLIGSIVVIVLSLIVSIFILVRKPEEEEFTIDGITTPENKEILKDAYIDDLKITNVTILMRDGISTFKAQVFNEAKDDMNVKKLKVVFYEGDKQFSMTALRDAVISTGSSVYINVQSERDLSYVTKIDYILE